MLVGGAEEEEGAGGTPSAAAMRMNSLPQLLLLAGDADTEGGGGRLREAEEAEGWVLLQAALAWLGSAWLGLVPSRYITRAND